MTAIEQASLVILAPEAERLIGDLRERYDPSALEGMPAHITLLYPFEPPAVEEEVWEKELAGFLGSFSRFSYQLSRLRRFPDVLSLAPEPETPFRQLIGALLSRYPGGSLAQRTIPVPTPHLAVARAGKGGSLDEIWSEAEALVRGNLPIGALADRVTLMILKGGRWSEERSFSLGR